MNCLLVLVALVAAGPARVHAQAPDANELIGRASRVYRSLGNLRADFVQVIDNPMIDSAESKGRLVQSGDAKLSMRFTDPPGEAIVIDGKHVWIYTPSTVPGQVIRMRASGGPVYGYNLLAWLLDRPAERYRASYLRSERVAGRSTDVIRLVPAVPDLPFTRAVIWLDREDALPRKLEIHEQSGATRTLSLSGIRVNQAVPKQTFTFKVPAGARVVDQ
jgi:outer membrane lipoprotein carrier protein